MKVLVFFLIFPFVLHSIYGQDTEGVSGELRIKLETLSDPNSFKLQGEAICCRAAVPRFYQSRLFEAAWNDYLASELIAAIRDCENEGLNPLDYHLTPLNTLSEKEELSNYERADFELLLTDAFLLLSSHLMSGKVDPKEIDPNWKVIRREGDPVQLLNEALASRNVRNALESIKPNFKAYRRLKERLLTYRKIAEDGGWPVVSGGAALKVDMESPRVELLRRRLRMTGDLKSYTVEDLTVYDEVVAEAVQVFQKRHGLTADGNLGKETLTALNVPVEERLEQIILNLERCRWLPQNLGSRYIMVNLPAFELEVVKEGNVDLEMNVAVGKIYRQTPVFSAKMTYLVFNPYWTIPPTILAQDIIPAQRKNPNHLNNLNIKVLARDGSVVAPSAVDWAGVNPRAFPYTLRQEPGPNNAMGQVKFMFPNSYNIYMHDTNHRELFSKTERALSSGCIRLEKPMDMAHYLLSTDGSWTPDKIKEVVRSRQNYTVILKEPVEVHLQYWTTFIDETGLLNFRKDIYNRDQRVSDALKAKPPEI